MEIYHSFDKSFALTSKADSLLKLEIQAYIIFESKSSLSSEFTSLLMTSELVLVQSSLLGSHISNSEVSSISSHLSKSSSVEYLTSK